jgi:hypothetical protein
MENVSRKKSPSHCFTGSCYSSNLISSLNLRKKLKVSEEKHLNTDFLKNKDISKPMLQHNIFMGKNSTDQPTDT